MADQKDAALKALDEAFTDTVKKLFDAVINASTGGQPVPESIKHFAKGYDILLRAFEQARSIINGAAA